MSQLVYAVSMYNIYRSQKKLFVNQIVKAPSQKVNYSYGVHDYIYIYPYSSISFQPLPHIKHHFLIFLFKANAMVTM